jgi:hypothetical protein
VAIIATSNDDFQKHRLIGSSLKMEYLALVKGLQLGHWLILAGGALVVFGVVGVIHHAADKDDEPASDATR